VSDAVPVAAGGASLMRWCLRSAAPMPSRIAVCGVDGGFCDEVFGFYRNSRLSLARGWNSRRLLLKA
jgi:hypothetical protein